MSRESYRQSLGEQSAVIKDDTNLTDGEFNNKER